MAVQKDTDILDFLKESFHFDNDVKLSCLTSGLAAIKSLKQYAPDLVVVGSYLEDISVESVCREIINTFPQVPIIVMGNHPDEETHMKLLEMGVDHYIRFPIDSKLLIATINSKLVKKDRIENNNHNGEDPSILKAGKIEMDLETFEVKSEGKLVNLTHIEFELLKLLLINQGIVLTREKILNAIWGYSVEVDTRVVDVHVGHLRKKFDKKGKPSVITTITGFGYKLNPQ